MPSARKHRPAAQVPLLVSRRTRRTLLPLCSNAKGEPRPGKKLMLHQVLEAHAILTFTRETLRSTLSCRFISLTDICCICVDYFPGDGGLRGRSARRRSDSSPPHRVSVDCAGKESFQLSGRESGKRLTWEDEEPKILTGKHLTKLISRERQEIVMAAF